MAASRTTTSKTPHSATATANFKNAIVTKIDTKSKMYHHNKLPRHTTQQEAEPSQYGHEEEGDRAGGEHGIEAPEAAHDALPRRAQRKAHADAFTMMIDRSMTRLSQTTDNGSLCEDNI